MYCVSKWQNIIVSVCLILSVSCFFIVVESGNISIFFIQGVVDMMFWVYNFDFGNLFVIVGILIGDFWFSDWIGFFYVINFLVD